MEANGLDTDHANSTLGTRDEKGVHAHRTAVIWVSTQPDADTLENRTRAKEVDEFWAVTAGLIWEKWEP